MLAFGLGVIFMRNPVSSAMCLVVSFIGLKAVFQYEKFAGLVLAVVFIIMYGEVASFGNLVTDTALEGSELSGTALTLFAVVYGSSASWCSIVADYYVEYPVDTSKWKVFILTSTGICRSSAVPAKLCQVRPFHLAREANNNLMQACRHAWA